MAATFGGASGAIADGHASQGTGALSTGIGVGGNSSGPPKAGHADMAADLAIQRIGGATQAVVALGTGYGAGKATRYRVATGAVANGAAVAPSTYINRSGRALVAGEGVWAVAP
jgi:hypothetical protein